MTQSYAFVVSRNFAETAGALRDRLVASAGFERREATDFVTLAKAEQAQLDLHGHAGRIVVRPVAITLSEKPDLKSIPKPLRDKVSWKGWLNRLTISAPLTKDEAEVLTGAVTPDTAAAAIAEAVEACRTTASEFFQTPAELGERFRVPQLALWVQSELRLFDDPEVLDYPWDVTTYDAAPTADDIAALGAGLKVSEGGEIDIDSESGKVVSRFLPELQRDLGLVYGPENWDEVRLATWLCRNLPEPSLTQASKQAFVAKWLTELLRRDGFTLSRANLQKSLLRNLLEARIRHLRQQAVSRAFQVVEQARGACPTDLPSPCNLPIKRPWGKNARMTDSPPTLKFSSAPRHVLIVRLSAMGDVVFASGLIAALSVLWPGVRISWLIEDTHADLLRSNPRIHRVIQWPRGRWLEWLKRGRLLAIFQSAAELLGTLHVDRYDLVLDTQGLLKSGIWAWLAGASVRVGLGSREGSQWLMTHVLDRRTEGKQFGGEYRKLSEFLGSSPAGFQPAVAVDPRARDRALRKLAKQPTRAYAVLAPFTTRPQKHWVDAHWVALSGILQRDFGLTPVLLGGPGDRKAAQVLAKASQGAIRDLTGETSLAESMALIEAAHLVVGVDTGLTHLGVTLQVPTVALFGATRPYLDHGAPGFRVVYEDLPCAPCRWHPTCAGRFDCMRNLAPQRVGEAVRAVLASRRSANA